MIGDERVRDLEPEALVEHRRKGLHLHLAEAGQPLQPSPEVIGVHRFRPHLRRVAAVLADDRPGELLHAGRHCTGKSVDGRLLAEYILQPLRIDACDLRRVEATEPLLDLERSGERGRHRHLLVEREADEERKRVFRDQPVGGVVTGEVQAVRCRHGPIVQLLYRTLVR